MPRGLLILIVLFGFVVTAPAQTVNINGKPVPIVWLGSLPAIDVLVYQYAKDFHMAGSHGMMIRDDAILRSEDGGLIWKIQSKAKTEGGSSAFDFIEVTRDSNDLLYGMSMNGCPGYDNCLFISHDDGSTWKQTAVRLKGATYFAATANPQNGIIILVGGKVFPIRHLDDVPRYALGLKPYTKFVPSIAVSRDQGKTWHVTNMSKDIGHIDSVKMFGRYGVAFGSFGVYVTTDGGMTWRPMGMHVDSDEDEPYPVFATVIGDRLWVCLKNGRVLSGPITGHRIVAKINLHGIVGDLSFVDSCLGFATIAVLRANGFQDGMIKTEDGGHTWDPVSNLKDVGSLTLDGTDLYGLTPDHVFRLSLAESRSGRSCSH
jgi:photosystem II stability/assembly factor-like uncharacterized protein